MFWRLPNFLYMGDGIGNLLEHLSLFKEQILDIGERDMWSAGDARFDPLS